jgi:hypothetical protein
MATLNIFRNRNPYREKLVLIGQYLRSEEFAGARMGLLTAALLILAFVAAGNLMPQSMFIFLPVLNTFIMAPGIYYRLKAMGAAGEVDYFDGLKAGAGTVAVSCIIYALFLVANAFIQDGLYWNSFGFPLRAAVCLFFETLISGTIISYCLMQYFKKA